MAEKKLTVNEFWKILGDLMAEIAEENGWTLSNNSQRGWAFQKVCADLIAKAEPTFETDPEDAMMYAKDLKADLIFEDSNSSHLLICQCKYRGKTTKRKDVSEEEVNDFFSRHEQYQDRDWIEEFGSEDVKQALADYGERIDEGWSVSFYFITTRVASERVFKLVDRKNSDYQQMGVTFELFDLSRFKEYYISSQSLVQSIPDEVTFDLPSKLFFVKDSPRRTLVAVVKGNTLRDLKKRYKQSLLAWNIRGYLGNRGINKSISETARDSPDDFYYFNNGVSAICTQFEVTDNCLTANKMQIINGAQTTSILENAAANPDIDVLLRLTETSTVSTEKGFNQQIIRFNNSQNSVKLSDFRSNDEIQRHLEQKLTSRTPHAPVPKILYLPKRAVGKGKKGSRSVKLEELGKIRYSFLHEPTAVHADPKSIWTLKEDGGRYTDAFGVDGELVDAWGKTTLSQCILALIIYWKVDDWTKAKAKEDSDLRYLRRLRYHGVSLAGLYIEKYYPDNQWNSLTNNESKFEKFWEDYWPVCRWVLNATWTTAEAEGSTLFAFLRSGDRWRVMNKMFRRQLAGADA